MKKTFLVYEEMKAFVAPLIAEDKWFIDIRKNLKTEEYTVEWQEHKTYIAHGDGKEYRDEIWITADAVPYFVQDLTEDHAKNILRMILRQERQQAEMLQNIEKDFLDEISDITLDDLDLEEAVDSLFPESTRPGKPPILH